MKTRGKKLAVGFLIVLFALEPASAFHPKDYGHLGITRTALSGISVVVQGQTFKFSDRAIDQIVQANKWGEVLQGLSFVHFDSEEFVGGTEHLVLAREFIVSKIMQPSPDGQAARQRLGEALHTLQDYYSHSNWISLTTYPGTIDSRLGRQSWGQGNTGPPPTATVDIPTCETDHNNLEGTGFTWLTTGYFDSVNWCYAGPENKGKCRHGGIPILCPGGISKDEPGRDGFPVAKQLAIQATTDYVNQILNDPQVAGNAKAIKALMDVGGTLAVAVDTTNMNTELPLLQAELTNVVNEVRNTEDEPAQYVLVHYDEFQVAPPVVAIPALLGRRTIPC